MMEAVRGHDRVGVRTGRGVGKTGCAAFIVHWFVTCHYPARVVTAAGTWNHLTEKLWPEIRMWGRRWLLRDAWEYQDKGMYNREDPDGWRVVAETSNQAENVEGHHSPNLLILVDEAKGMPDEIFSALIASLTSDVGGVQKIAALSTPPLVNGGWFAKASTSSSWHLVHVSGLDSTRVSKAYTEGIRKDYGDESPEYQSYVLGNIPEGATEAVVQSRWVEAAQARPANPQDRRGPVLTCDVAREGEDLTTIGLLEHAKFGLVRFAEDGRWGWFSGQDLMETCGRLLAAAKQTKARVLVIDDTGLGGGVTDRLREMQARGEFPKSCSIMPIKFGSTARRDDRFHQRKDELWWTTREALRDGVLALPDDDEVRAWGCPRGSDFKAQMTSALYEYDSLDRIDVLDKRKPGKEKTKALPPKSPDLAHALVLGVEAWLRSGQAAEVPPPPATGEEALMRTVQEVVRRTMKPTVSDPYRRAR